MDKNNPVTYNYGQAGVSIYLQYLFNTKKKLLLRVRFQGPGSIQVFQRYYI